MRRWTTIAVAFASVLCCAAGASAGREPPGPAASAPAEAPKDLSADLAKVVADLKVAGLAVAVVMDGRVLGQGVAGVRELGKPEPITLSDKFHLGSCTKAMTATLAGISVERGEITWDTTLAQVFKDIPMKDGWKAVTLRHLLQHRGLVPAWPKVTEAWKPIADAGGSPMAQRVAALTALVATEPTGAAGERYEYSNWGVSFAGAMLERVTGKPWETLLRERLYEPLGLTTAGLGPPGRSDVVDQPRGHKGGKAINPSDPGSDNDEIINPGSRAHMSITDWARFVNEHAVGESGGSRLLKPETFRAIHKPALGGDYAMCWGVSRRPWAHGDGVEDVGVTLSHNGSNLMWYCVCWVAPERGLSIVAACNQGDRGTELACDRAVAVAMMLVPPTRDVPAAAPPTGVPAPR